MKNSSRIDNLMQEVKRGLLEELGKIVKLLNVLMN